MRAKLRFAENEGELMQIILPLVVFYRTTLRG
jgi:hypothetical protein